MSVGLKSWKDWLDDKKKENLDKLKDIFVNLDDNQKGVVSIVGKWPGSESDEDVERALRELS